MTTDTLIPEPANPGANKTITLYDSSASGQDVPNRDERRAMVVLFADQVVTVKVSVRTQNGQWRQHSSDASSISTLLEKDYPLWGDHQKIELITTTAPTVWEVSCRIVTQRAALT